MFALRRPLSAIDPLLIRAVRKILQGWRVGCLSVRFPDGTELHFGDATSTQRATVIVRDERAVARVLFGGETAAGEAWMDGQWDSPDLPAVLALYVHNRDALRLGKVIPWLGELPGRLLRQLRRNTREGSRRNVQAHYDLGNDFYRLFLDEKMAYSCAIWGEGDALEDAQVRKMERACELLDLHPGDHLLEIGCGWGALAVHAARTRGCRVTAVTLSPSQLEIARARVAAAGLSDRIDVQLRDYRDLDGRYDKIVSIEMFEAVGAQYWDDYFRTCARLLAPGGRKVLQTIVVPDDRLDRYHLGADWTERHVFPGMIIPSVAAFTASAARAGLRVDTLDRIGPHYAPTLRAWRERFLARREEARRLGKDERFLRMWEMYLAYSEHAFAAGSLDDVQAVLRPAMG